MAKTSTIPKRSWADWPGWPYVLIGVAVLLRLAHIWNSRTNPTFWAPAVDPAWFDEAAVRITQGDWGPFPFFRAPVYPALLAAVYSVFGHDLFAARILNVVLQGATVWMIWHIGRSYFSSAVGVIAAALFALNGMAIYFACELVSPSVEMLTAVLCAWGTFRLFRDPGTAAVITCGLSYGLAAITRPNFLTVVPVAVLAVWFSLLLASPRKGKQSRTRVRFPDSASRLLTRTLVFLVAVFIPILPVTATNIIKGKEFVLIATQGGVNFWIGNNPQSTGVLSILPGYGNIWTMEDAAQQAARETGRALSQSELSSYYYQKGWNFFKQYPAQATRLMIRKAALFVNRYEISNNKHITYFAGLSPWLPWLIRLNFGVLLPLGVVGIVAFWRRPEVKVLLGLIILYAVSVILFFVTARFRMPVVPWLCWLAAAGGVWLVQAWKQNLSLRKLAPLYAMLAALVLVYMDIWGLRDAPVGWARFMEANAYMKMNQYDSARVAFLDAIREGQEIEQSHLNLGVLSYRLRNFPEAEYWFNKTLAIDSGSWKAWNNLGLIADAQGDHDRAIARFRHALQLNPLYSNARENLGGVYFRQGIEAFKRNRDSLAVTYLDSSVTTFPEPVAYYDLALAYTRLGRNDLADKALSRALSLNPELEGAAQLRDYLRSGGTSPPPGGSPP